jgi:outer membrane immunogenic protein
MKKVLAAFLAASMVAGQAMAADVEAPVYRTPPPLPEFSWTGFYIGGTLGGEWATSDYSETPTGAFIHARAFPEIVESGIPMNRVS